MSSKWLALVGAGMHTKDSASGGFLTPRPGKINGWNPKIEVFDSNNFPHENWVTFRFHVKFRGSIFWFLISLWRFGFQHLSEITFIPQTNINNPCLVDISLLTYVHLSSASTKCRPIYCACHGYCIKYNYLGNPWKSNEFFPSHLFPRNLLQSP